ncbi:hypothetical protein ACFVGN_34660 [Streptomyces sp. NPDC057757]|uniref:hypothetical protein n=1 Tax=Streptomyces sp. NPDC057757 TaxID=3346241 RepID=UPI0036ACCFFF
MAFISFPGWQPGMVMTADRLESSSLPGRLVFRATRDTSQSIPDTTSANPDSANVFSWESVEVDDLGGFSGGSPTRYTCMLDGWYRIDAKAAFNANVAGGVRTLGVFETGVLVPSGHFRNAKTPTNFVDTVTGFVSLLLSAGDYVQMAPGQNTGGALLTATGGTRPSIEISFNRHV